MAIKTWKGRLNEIWTFIKAQNPQAGVVTALEGYVNGLTDANKKLLSNALSQGTYDAGVTKADEKTNRQFRRALGLILTARAGSGTAAVDLQRGLAAVAAHRAPADIQNRVKQELQNRDLAQMQLMMRQQGASPQWVGWDPTKQRPLKVGCAIGRRGTNGPGTLGCFVERGGNIYILSNYHVLMQGGSTDNEIVQPAHMTGGSYFDVVADYTDGDQTLDAAIAQVRGGLQVENVTPEGFAINGSSNGVALNQTVHKRGAATRNRVGEITDAAAANQVRPDLNNATCTHLFKIERDDNLDAFATEGIQVPGDSGSAVCDALGRVIGLMNTAGAGCGYATLIQPILTRFNVTILGGGVRTA